VLGLRLGAVGPVSVEYRVHRQAHREPAGLVLGHRVQLVAGPLLERADRARVVSLDGDVTVKLDRVRDSDGFRTGDRVLILPGGCWASVVSAAHGVLRLNLAGEE
jgi:hypothetical protein